MSQAVRLVEDIVTRTVHKNNTVLFMKWGEGNSYTNDMLIAEVGDS